MRNDHYPKGTSDKLISTTMVKPVTTSVLQKRLEIPALYQPAFFDPAEFKLLNIVCSLLIPQNYSDKQVLLAVMFDQKMVSGQGKGWRYDELPPDNELFKKGLKAIEETSSSMYNEKFIFLSYEKQHNVLSMIQSGKAEGEIWKNLSAALYFKELLASVTELYYSHPVAKDDIGEVAYADGLGWNKIGLNEHEKFEPLPISTGLNA